MPVIQTEIDWIPHDTSAASICEIMFNTANDPPSSEDSIFHIVNPNRVTWSDFLQSLRDNGLVFEEVSAEDWVSSLTKDDKNPAYKLLSFYQDMFSSLALPVWLTTKTGSVSQTLKSAPKLNSNLVSKYLQYWSVALASSQNQN
jgi:dTDP-4-dehydrorhamnose reductase